MPRAHAILGGFPFASDQPRSLQSLKGDKQRTCIEAENAFAHLFEPDGNPISVHGFKRQRFKDEHVQSALDEITRLVRHRRIPLEDQEEEYTSPTDCQEERGKLADIAIVVNRCVDILLPNRRDLARNDWLLTGAEGASMSGNYAIDVWP